MAREPDFIGIGFRRCASSWLHACLSDHPEIGKPPRGLHFFSREDEYRKGTAWYEAQLARYSAYPVVGEMSVSYSYPELARMVAERLQEHYPRAKLLCTVRNPILRAFSDYRRSVATGELDRRVGFGEALRVDPALVTRGFYSRILRPFRDRFADRLCVLVYDDLERAPLTFVQSAYRFLGVRSDYVPHMAFEARGHAARPRSQLVARTAMRVQLRVSRALRGVGLGWFLEILKKTHLRDAVFRLNAAPGGEVCEQQWDLLADCYREDVEELGQFLRRDLTAWLTM